MSRLIEFDTVRIIALNGRAEDHLAATAYSRLPQVGDIGTIVDLIPTDEPDGAATRYVVEKVEVTGTTVWLAEFTKDELELVPRHD